MRKSRFIVLIMVVSIMLMGAGYAQWTDILLLDTEVCTGDMNVEFDGVGSWVWCGNSGIQSSVARAYFDQGPDKNYQKVGFYNIFPGIKIEYYSKIDNTGTIPAELEQVLMIPGICDPALCENLIGHFLRVRVFDAAGVKVEEEIVNLFTLATLPNELEFMTEGLVIPAGGYMTIHAALDFPCYIDNTYDLEASCCEFLMELDFGQAPCADDVECPEGPDYFFNVDQTP